jgi:hypothetical protein
VEVTGGILETGGTPVTPFTYTFRTAWIQGTVTYYGNSNDGGTIPVDSTNYGQNAVVIVIDNTGSLTKTGFNFIGWNTAADGAGTTYSPGQTFNISTVGASLYAIWGLGSSVTYNGNGNTSGAVPTDGNLYGSGATVTVQGNTGSLIKIIVSGASYRFTGWNSQADGNGINYGSTFTMGSANVLLYAKWVPSELRNVGPAGGLIFYDKGSYSNGWRYLEAAAYDCGGSSWATLVDDPYYYVYTGVTNIAIGTGKINTNALVALDSSAVWYSAADVCDMATISSCGDWFLPSKDELNLMYLNLKTFGVGGFANADYWSSSEQDGSSTDAWAQSFSDGSQFWYYKSSGCRIRAARQF